jgi:hypothetical protein
MVNRQRFNINKMNECFCYWSLDSIIINSASSPSYVDTFSHPSTFFLSDVGWCSPTPLDFTQPLSSSAFIFYFIAHFFYWNSCFKNSSFSLLLFSIPASSRLHFICVQKIVVQHMFLFHHSIISSAKQTSCGLKMNWQHFLCEHSNWATDMNFKAHALDTFRVGLLRVIILTSF